MFRMRKIWGAGSLSLCPYYTVYRCIPQYLQTQQKGHLFAAKHYLDLEFAL
jgi:hypothetical protein